MKYKNRMKRKQFVRDTKWKLKRTINKTIDSVTKYLEGQQTFYEMIFRQIREGLDYGYGEIRYYMYNGNHYMPSIEVEYDNYKTKTEYKLSHEKVFDLMANSILPNMFSRYSDIELIVEEDEHGKYLEIKLVD
ncbi:hypothetical protein D7X33_25645 [Butyricicoccus sp. 1XD8-22]|nr:hypothetical protein D7X33_25645 [Butyricicoccus sp. 1XD8-22]